MELLLLLLPVLLLTSLMGGDDAAGVARPAGPADGDGTETPPEDSLVQDGSAQADSLQGTDATDLLLGDDGADTLDGGLGDDVLTGEAGADSLLGGGGADILIGGAGDDVLNGGAVGDLMIGNEGDDTLIGEGGDDIMIGHSGADSLSGGTGDDVLFGVVNPAFTQASPQGLADVAQRITELFPEATQDQVDRVTDGINQTGPADLDPDALSGGAGNDSLLGDNGDQMTGDDGADDFITLPVVGGAPTTVLDFAAGEDSVIILVADPATAVLTLFASGTPTGTMVRVDGQDVSFIAGIAPNALPNGAVTVQRI